MDEQIKPVAWIMPSAMKALSAEGSAMVGIVDQGIDLPLYSQQSIDALRAQLDTEANNAFVWEARALRAEAEAEALRADIDWIAANMRSVWGGLARQHRTDRGDYRFPDIGLIESGRDACDTADLRAAIDAARKVAE